MGAAGGPAKGTALSKGHKMIFEHMGARLRGEREARGLSRAELARLVLAALPEGDQQRPNVQGMADYIKRWESGKVRALSPRYQRAYATALGVDRGALFAAERDGNEASDGSALDLVFSASGAEPADSAFVEAIREAGRALVRLDDLHGGDDVYPLARRTFMIANRKLGTGALPSGLERDLMSATAEAAEIAAWLAYDADRQAESRQLIHEALILASQAGDRSMELFSLTHLAMQSVHLHRPAEALRFIDEDRLDGTSSPRVAALFALRRGRALAQLGDAPAAHRMLDLARTRLSESITPSDPSWTWWISEAELLWHRGTALTELGRWKEALPHLTLSAELRQGRRARLNDLAHLLNAQVRLHAWTDAEPTLTNIIDTHPEIGSTRTNNLLLHVTSRITATDHAPSTISDAAALLRETLAA